MVRINDTLIIEFSGKEEVKEAEEFRKICNKKGLKYNPILKKLVRNFIKQPDGLL